MGLSEEVHEKVRTLVASGYENHETVLQRIIESLPEEFRAGEDGETTPPDPEQVAQLRSLIDEEFARRLDEMQSWPATTDCDRLHEAFEALGTQGVVALENCGFTQDDGIREAAEVAEARNELGVRVYDGYCFFHEQDMQCAVEGGGLMLAFGTFRKNDALPGSEPTSTVCPTCHGRGFIQPDPSKFPQRCPSHIETVTTRPPTTHRQLVGEWVAKACRDAGLDVEWSGSTDTRIRLPTFEWQHRLILSTPSALESFRYAWELEMRGGYTPLEDAFEAFEERAGERLGNFADFGPAVLEGLRSWAKQLLERERAREATWTEATINDRISAAFEVLGKRGIHALECPGMTLRDGWAYARRSGSTEHRGVAFFHQEDVFDALNGGPLFVAFGALGVEATRDEATSTAVGDEIVRVLSEHGVPCEWNRSDRERIRISPFEWRKRRWTPAPAFERRSARAPVGSFWSKIFGKSPRGAGVTSAPQFAEVVKALRDERGFDVERSKKMREAWKRAGLAGEAQVGHLGPPHAFVRAGEYTTMMPVLASDNTRSVPSPQRLATQGLDR